MKRIVFVLSALMLFSSAMLYAKNYKSGHTKTSAKQDNEKLKGQLLDVDFQLGKVVFKDGTSSQENLNYHLPSNRICYINEQNEPFVLVELRDILMISYGNRTFVPVNNVSVAELLKTFSDGSRLLLQRQAKTEVGDDNSGAYGASTVTSSVVKLTSLRLEGHTSNFEVADDKSLVIREKFTLTMNGKNYTISKLKSLKKIYPSKWKAIEGYAAQNKPNLKNQQDLITLLEFCTK